MQLQEDKKFEEIKKKIEEYIGKEIKTENLIRFLARQLGKKNKL